MRFGPLLATVLFFLAAMPFAADTVLATFRFPLLFAVVLVAGVWTVSERRHELWIALGLALPAFAGSLAYERHMGSQLGPAGLVVGAAFLGFAGFVVVRAVLREDRVTLDTLLGGVLVYFLIGLMFALLFAALLALSPEALRFEVADAGDSFEAMLYYSYVTLTTLGYGDIVPRSEVARMLAAGEATVGQLYLAVLIARLVGLHISARSRES